LLKVYGLKKISYSVYRYFYSNFLQCRATSQNIKSFDLVNVKHSKEKCRKIVLLLRSQLNFGLICIRVILWLGANGTGWWWGWGWGWKGWLLEAA